MSASKAPYSAFAVANYFLEKSKSIDPLKLQKLIYYAHGWHLAHGDCPLIDESIEAWPYGPVIVSVYEEFKNNGYNPIKEKALKWDRTQMCFIAPELPKEDNFAKRVCDVVWVAYGDMSGIQLSNATHAPGTPWRKIWDGNDRRVIPDDLIKEFFKQKLNQAAQ